MRKEIVYVNRNPPIRRHVEGSHLEGVVHITDHLSTHGSWYPVVVQTSSN